MTPVAKKLETISDQIMITGDTILQSLRHEQSSFSDEEDSGFSYNFKSTVCPEMSYAVIDRPIYEKVSYSFVVSCLYSYLGCLQHSSNSER